jgi:hypothetical protein
MKFGHLINWRGYQYLALSDTLLLFNSAGTPVARYSCVVPWNVEYGRWWFTCDLNRLGNQRSLDFKNEVVGAWKANIDARLREDFNE